MAKEPRVRDQLIRQAEAGRQPFEPEVTLFVDESAESKQAYSLLEGSKDPFRTIFSNDPRTPVAVFGHSLYLHLSGIEALVNELRSFDADVRSAYQRHVQERQSTAGGTAAR